VTEATIIVDNDVVLDGEGNLTLDGDSGHRVLRVSGMTTTELRGVTVTRGDTSASGGGIINQGTLTLTNSTVSGNTAGFGAGIYNANGRLTLANSTVSGNTAGTGGGGIYNANGGTLTLTNSTVSGNTAGFGGGGGIINQGTLTLTSSSLSGNTATQSDGGGIDNGGTATLANSIFDGDCAGNTPLSGGHNVESPGNTCGFNQTGDESGVSAEQLSLGALADNGGPTLTHALAAGSVAIDVIPPADCVDADGTPVTTDQRGEPRPETGGTMCDIGAFEVQP
jgi:hypothetical protein